MTQPSVATARSEGGARRGLRSRQQSTHSRLLSLTAPLATRVYQQREARTHTNQRKAPTKGREPKAQAISTDQRLIYCFLLSACGCVFTLATSGKLRYKLFWLSACFDCFLALPCFLRALLSTGRRSFLTVTYCSASLLRS